MAKSYPNIVDARGANMPDQQVRTGVQVSRVGSFQDSEGSSYDVWYVRETHTLIIV